MQGFSTGRGQGRAIGRVMAGLLLLGVLSTACAHHQVGYRIEGVPNLSSGPLSELRLTVRTFEDAREPALVDPQGSAVRQGTIERDDGETWYVNSDAAYKDGSIAAAIAGIVAKHLAASHMFREVAVDADPAGYDAVLSGRVERFVSFRKRRIWAEAFAAQPSLIGVVAAATEKTPYEAQTVLNLSLRSAAGDILWEGRVEGEVSGEGAVSSGGLEVYPTADLALRRAVEQLVEELARVRPPEASSASVAPAVAETAETSR